LSALMIRPLQPQISCPSNTLTKLLIALLVICILSSLGAAIYLVLVPPAGTTAMLASATALRKETRKTLNRLFG
ncbi:hypothetical protein FOZ62_006049, partial [Perkinsus olseni]